MNQNKCFRFSYKSAVDSSKHVGWIGGINEASVKFKLINHYGLNPQQIKTIELKDTGRSWDDFISEGERFGWD